MVLKRRPEGESADKFKGKRHRCKPRLTHSLAVTIQYEILVAIMTREKLHSSENGYGCEYTSTVPAGVGDNEESIKFRTIIS